MLVLLFHLDDDGYAIRCDRVREIVPLVNLEALPTAPDYVAGLLNYRGQPTPVLDLCRLVLDRPCRRRYSSRIIVVDYVRPGEIEARCLGVLAEGVTETARVAEESLVSSGFDFPVAPFLGDLILSADEVLRRVDVDGLPDAFHGTASAIEESDDATRAG